MISVLVVAEKPAAANAIAEALSGRNSRNKRSGKSPACPVWTFVGVFKNQSVNYKVTSTVGHVFELDFVGAEANNWSSDPAILFDAKTAKREANPKLHVKDHLIAEAKGCTHLVLCLDGDREGENICFEVIDSVKNSLSGDRDKRDQIWRARFSALDAPDILKSFANLGKPDKNLSDAVDARQVIDLKIGCAFTRYQTLYFQGKYGDLQSHVISYGPCQTPSLQFCVARHYEILKFEPETYFTINLHFTLGNTNADFSANYSRNPIFDKTVTDILVEFMSNEKVAYVSDVKETNEKLTKPAALDTVTLLKKCSSECYLSPLRTMQIAERLYLSKYITYPRTETNSYSPNFDFGSIAKMFTSHSTWGAATRSLIERGFGKPRGGVDMGDHPPITPLIALEPSQLGAEEWKVYEKISSIFLSSISHDAVFKRKIVKLWLPTCSESFTLSGHQLVQAGFLAFQGNTVADSFLFPSFMIGDEIPVSKIVANTQRTSPPPYLSESDLVTLMQRNGIGTDASIPQHINNIVERNYVVLEPQRRLRPSKLGISLVRGYSLVDLELILPKVRAEIEKSVTIIAEGKASMDDVVDHSLDTFKAKYKYFVEHIDAIDALFEASFTTLAESGKPFSRCGTCRRYLVYIQKIPQRLFCRTCNATFRLPKGGSIKSFKEKKCSWDNFEIVLFAGTNGKNYPLCPMCYCHPPVDANNEELAENLSNRMTIFNSMTSQAIAQCPLCEEGLLCLNPDYQAKKWTIVCNLCSFLLKSNLEEVKEIEPADYTCDSCGDQVVKLVFKNPRNNRAGKSSSTISDCLRCFEGFHDLVDPESWDAVCGEENVIFPQKGFARRGRGGRGGRGGRRGRRGDRGRRGKNFDPKMTFDGF